MDKIWAPWRKEYILQKKAKGCIFCTAPKEDRDRKNYIVKRTGHSFAILNLFPYNNGHLMVAPYRHTKDLEGLTDGELLDLMDLLKTSKRLLNKVLKPAGFNIGINIGKSSGAGIINHLHIHIVPRWTGDMNFMPVISDTKVIPESLESLYSRLTSEGE